MKKFRIFSAICAAALTAFCTLSPFTSTVRPTDVKQINADAIEYTRVYYTYKNQIRHAVIMDNRTAIAAGGFDFLENVKEMLDMLLKKIVSALLSAVLVLGVAAPAGGVWNSSDNSLNANAIGISVYGSNPVSTYGTVDMINNLTYKEESGCITITAIITRKDSAIIGAATRSVPEKINGLPVTKIAPRAYSGLSEDTNINTCNIL